MGSVAILNDITHCLRHGDITVPVHGTPRVLEIKSGRHQNPRTVRQEARLNKVMDYLATDTVTDLYEPGQQMVRSAPSLPEVSLSPCMNNLLTRVTRGKCGGAQAEGGVYYFSARTTRDVAESLGQFIELNRLQNGFVLEFLNLRKFEPRAYYPLVLSLTSPKDVYEFYAGQLYLWVIVDVAVIAQAFRRNGLFLEFDQHSDFPVWGNAAATPNPSDRRVGISSHLFGRVFYEFASLDWVLGLPFGSDMNWHNNASNRSVTPDGITSG
jgi:hypothetical protein